MEREADGPAWFVDLDACRELDLVALEWTRSRSDDLMLRLATALGRYWALNGSITEGRASLDAALAPGTGDPALRATAGRRSVSV